MRLSSPSQDSPAPFTPVSSCNATTTTPRTASEVLATFSPRSQPKKTPLYLSPSPQKFPIAMMASRHLRIKKEPVTYEISSDSESNDPSSQPDSSFSSPEKQPRKRRSRDELEDEESEEMESLKTPPPRISSAGHSLRQHNDLKLSLQARENGDKPVSKKRKTQKRRSKIILKNTAPKAQAPPRTARNEIREFINTETAGKRAKFFVANSELFLPLLPEGNHIQKLVAQYGRDVETFPYEVLERQPSGVVADMKPYQLLGLSFLVYLHRNGLSGILGDEMGLGKTLQTLSLFQYLKDNRNHNSTNPENRPCLVVCPLSVLSSWMAESRRWTPDLKVLRFHGSSQERDRLKKIATGELDQYGNQTLDWRKRKNDRLTAAGKTSIDVGSDLDEESGGQTGVDLVVTTYEGFLAEQAWFKRSFVWSYIVLDEGHKAKNAHSLISKALQGLGAEYRLILTGTPLQNNLQELWALLHWLYPEIFTEKTADLFKNSFNLSKGQVSTQVMDDARRLLEVIMLRRMKNSPGVNLNLPPKTEVLLYVPLTPMQRFWYMRLLTRADKGLLEDLFDDVHTKESLALQQETRKTGQEADFLMSKDIEDLEKLDTTAIGEEDAIKWEESKEIMRQALKKEQADGKSSAWKKLMNLLMQLRKCCNHPYILPHAEPDPYYIGEHVMHASGKFIVLDKIIKELVVKQKKKVLIFSGFTRMLDYCEDFLALRGGTGEEFKYVRLDGGTSRARRNLGIRMFNQQDTNYRVMLISTRAGGLGINLATASDVIMLDQDWNPQIMLQAEARAHRIGQDKPVTVYKLCTQGTVEEQMMGRIQKKLYLSAKVTESMRDIHFESASKSKKKGPGGKLTDAAEDDMPQLDTSQLMSLVRRGAQALAHPEIDINEMMDWGWETMLERCKDQPADVHVAEQTQAAGVVKEEDEKKWLSQIEQVQARVFQGQKHKKAGESTGYDSIAQEWSRESRRVGKNTTVLIDGHVVSKESTRCADWEAVPTMAGKNPSLAEVKRDKKPEVLNQNHCQVCWNGGEIILCSGCPRSFHYGCLDKNFKAKSKAKINFHCPQHQCVDCEQNTTNAGGMIYRCRWCERGYCEDCLDWDKTGLLGENLKEYELLGFPKINQAFYIKCPSCHDHHLEEPQAREFCTRKAAKIDKQYEKEKEQEALMEAAAEVAKKSVAPPTPADSMTSASTMESSGITTPSSNRVDKASNTGVHKRKAAPTTFGYDGVPLEISSGSSTPQRKLVAEATPPTKRSKRLSG